MASDLRMDVLPYGDGRVLLTLGALSLTLDAAACDQLRELLDRAAMPGQPAAACERCGHRAHPDTPLECQWCPEGYCESPAALDPGDFEWGEESG
jgi:hypothetical protein